MKEENISVNNMAEDKDDLVWPPEEKDLPLEKEENSVSEEPVENEMDRDGTAGVNIAVQKSERPADCQTRGRCRGSSSPER